MSLFMVNLPVVGKCNDNSNTEYSVEDSCTQCWKQLCWILLLLFFKGREEQWLLWQIEQVQLKEKLATLAHPIAV